MSATRLGQLLMAVAFVVLGGLNLAWADFAYIWQPVPSSLPWREPLAYAAGALLGALGLGMLLSRTARLATLLLTASLVAWLLLTRLPSLLASPGVEVRWLFLGETLMLLAGSWTLLSALSPGGSGRPGRLAGPAATRLARLLYAVALPMVGLSHFVYLKITVSMIPGWIPFHLGFAYLTGAAHIAAGLALLTGVLPRLAATAEAAMISLFTVVVEVALLVGQPGNHFRLTNLFVSVALAGAAWVVAGSLDGAPWGLRSSKPDVATGSSAQ